MAAAVRQTSKAWGRESSRVRCSVGVSSKNGPSVSWMTAESRGGKRKAGTIRRQWGPVPCDGSTHALNRGYERSTGGHGSMPRRVSYFGTQP
jgi:hypothetical protein